METGSAARGNPCTRCKRESAPDIGRTGAPLVLRVAEPELAREPRTPGAERQGSSAQARRLHELRSAFRFTSLAKKIRMTLAVIPQMRLRRHGSSPFNFQDAEQSPRLPLRCRAAVTPLVDQDEVLSCELMATSDALERRKDGLRCFASIFRQVAHAREGGWGTDVPPPSDRPSPAPARSSQRGSRKRRRRSGSTCATRWPSGNPRRPSRNLSRLRLAAPSAVLPQAFRLRFPKVPSR